MGFGTIKTLFTLLLLNKSTVNKLIRFLPSFDSQRKITKQHGIPVLPELSMVSTCDVYFFFGLVCDCSPPLCHYRPRPRLARHSRTRPRIPESRQRSVCGARRVVLGSGSERQAEAVVPPDTRPRDGQPFLSACLKTVYQLMRFSTLLSFYKAISCCLHSDFHRATVKAHRTWLRFERFKSRSSSRLFLCDADCGSAAPNRAQRRLN